MSSDKNSIDQKNAPHYIWGNNCDSWILVDTKELSKKQERMPEGSREDRHYHLKGQQFFYVMKGTATFYIEKNRLEVMVQQGLLIEPKCRHYIANATTKQLIFLVISQPSTSNDRTIIETL